MSRFAFVDVVAAVEQRLVQALGLRPRELPADLSHLEGAFREQPVTLRARAYAGPALAYARFVEVSGPELEIGNILLFARPELALPVLGVDLVGLGRDTAVVVADLSPMSPNDGQRREQLAVLARQRSLPPLGAATDLPAWAHEWFSSEALCTRVSNENAGQVAAAVAEFCEAFVKLVQQAPASESAATADPGRARFVAERQLRYSASHRQDDRGLLLLRRMFEPARADRFLREVLFPERLPA